MSTFPSKAPVRHTGVLSRVTHRWVQILVLWLVISFPILYLIHHFVEPRFEAFSTLRIEPVQRDMYAPKQEEIEYSLVTPFLATQSNLITCDRVLGDAITYPGISKLSAINELNDAKNDLRKMMTVEIVKDAFLIRVALGLSDGDQAAKIVNAVVQSYLAYNGEYKRSANRQLRANLVAQRDTFNNEIKEKQAELETVSQQGTVDAPIATLRLDPSGNENDSLEPVFSSVAEEQSQQVAAEIINIDLNLIKAQAILETTSNT